MNHTEAIVIGAGAAGLMAALELRAAGRGVIVLEAAERAGGRLLTVYRTGPDCPIELGAEFLHGEAPITRGLLDRFGLRFVEAVGESALAAGGQVRLAPRAFAQVDRVLRRIDVRGEDSSFADWLAREPGGASLAEARRAALRFVEGYHAADATRLSVQALAEASGDAGAVQCSGRILVGHGALVHSMHSELGDAVRLQTAATRVEWRPGACVVRTRSREHGAGTCSARCVIVTASVGVLRSGALAIEPLPAAAARALDRLAMGDVVRIPFIFRERFWEEEGILPQGDVSFLHTPDSPFTVWWTQRPVSTPMLVAWAGGRSARALLQLEPIARMRRALADLARALGVSARRLERLLVHWEMHDWSADPLMLGGYSYALVGGAGASRELARVHQQTLAFAGEATGDGTVEAAFESGRRAARLLLRALT